MDMTNFQDKKNEWVFGWSPQEKQRGTLFRDFGVESGRLNYYQIPPAELARWQADIPAGGELDFFKNFIFHFGAGEDANGQPVMMPFLQFGDTIEESVPLDVKNNEWWKVFNNDNFPEIGDRDYHHNLSLSDAQYAFNFANNATAPILQAAMRSLRVTGNKTEVVESYDYKSRAFPEKLDGVVKYFKYFQEAYFWIGIMTTPRKLVYFRNAEIDVANLNLCHWPQMIVVLHVRMSDPNDVNNPQLISFFDNYSVPCPPNCGGGGTMSSSNLKKSKTSLNPDITNE